MKRLGVVVLAVLVSLTVSPSVWGAPMHSFHAGGFHPGGFHGGHFVVGVGVGAVVTARFWYPWYRNPVYGYPAYPAYPASVYWYWQDPPGYYPLCHPVSRRVDDGRAASTLAGRRGPSGCSRGGRGDSEDDPAVLGVCV